MPVQRYTLSMYSTSQSRYSSAVHRHTSTLPSVCSPAVRLLQAAQWRRIYMAFEDYKEFLVKLLTLLSGACLFILGFSTVFSQHTYTSSLVCFYLMLFSTIIILTELSPYILGNYLVALFPFLDKPAARGVFYALLGTFCFGEEMGSFGLATGVCVIMAGVLNIIFSKFSTKPKTQAPRNIGMSSLLTS